MPWSKADYPVSLKNLPAAVRNKAIEIANALLGEGKMKDEGIVIATATSRAKDWAANCGLKTKSKVAGAKTTDVKEHGKDKYVAPTRDHDWAVKEEGKPRPEAIYHDKAAAVKKATREAKAANTAVTVQSDAGKIQKRTSFNPRNTVKK